MSQQHISNTTTPVVPRRSFFRLMLAEAMSLTEEVQGRPQMCLSELAQVPDEVLRRMSPVFNEARSYSIEKNCVLLQHRKRGTPQTVYQLESSEHYMLRFFDGQHTLEEIGRRVADEFGQDEETAYQEVKALFIALAKYAICHPAQAYDFDHETHGTHENF